MIDRYPRTYQADIHRLHVEVIRPALQSLPLLEPLSVEGGESIEDRLDRLAGHVLSHTALEARRAFVLILAGAFERQLRAWIARDHRGRLVKPVAKALFDELLAAAPPPDRTEAEAPTVEACLKEMHLAANVVRHGQGGSTVLLRLAAPALWRRLDNASRPVDDHDIELHVEDATLERYVAAVVHFWGSRDPEFGAVLSAP